MNFNIFSEEYIDPGLPDSNIKYFKNFLSAEEAEFYFQKFMKDISWQQHYIKIFGKTIAQPRLSALYAKTQKSYTYSGLTLVPLPYLKEMEELQQKLELISNAKFTHCLANLYRDGNDSMGLHADDEKELGENPVIASLSFGETRKFRLKHKIDKKIKFEIELHPGSLLLMQGKTQHFYKHELPRATKSLNPRINLTYRRIVD